MKGVLLVGARPPPSGGVATHLAQLEQTLRAHGVRVRTVDPRRHGPDGRDGRPRLIGALALARLRGDLVHLHTNGHNRNSWLLAALCSAARPALLTLHSGLAPAFLRAHPRLVERVCRRYVHVIAVNREIAAELAHAGVAAERVVIASAFSPAAQELALAPPGLGAIRRRHALVLACALAPGAEYGADLLLDGFRVLLAQRPDAALLLYGPGTRDPALAGAVGARGLERAVYHFGELSRARALAVVAAADVFLRPTRADGDALSVREALALGRPVVASEVGHRPAGVTLFPVGDTAALVESIFRVLGKPSAQPLPSEDCLPALLALYRRAGIAATVGTGLAIVSESCVASPDGSTNMNPSIAPNCSA